MEISTDHNSDSIVTGNSEAAPVSLPNIYHIVLDAYSAPAFTKLAQSSDLAGAMDGFTVFPNNMANYLVTVASGPSYMTGKLYKSGSFKDFQLEAKFGGLPSVLKRTGYKIASYSPNRTRFWSHNDAEQVVTSRDGVLSTAKQFALVLAVRAAPELLREDTKYRVEKLLSSDKIEYSYYKRLSVPLMQQFLADESSRESNGHYNYVHLLIPHPPFVWGSDCAMNVNSDYIQQAECANLLLQRFIDKLRDEGRYENSLILIHSDHGTGLDIGLKNPYPPMTADVTKKLAESSLYFPPMPLNAGSVRLC